MNNRFFGGSGGGGGYDVGGGGGGGRGEGGVQSYGTHTDEKAALYRDSLDIKGLFVCLSYCIPTLHGFILQCQSNPSFTWSAYF